MLTTEEQDQLEIALVQFAGACVRQEIVRRYPGVVGFAHLTKLAAQVRDKQHAEIIALVRKLASDAYSRGANNAP